MSLWLQGMDLPVPTTTFATTISTQHPLIILANSICWEEITKAILLDLSCTPKISPFSGRRLMVRIHLGVYILQSIFGWTDRQTEFYIKSCPLFQLFCGYGIVPNFHVPDHTKIEEFRNRLRPSSQKDIANLIAKHAAKKGYADPRWMDIDSTVQEAFIKRPSEIYLLEKLAIHVKKIFNYIKENFPQYISEKTNQISITYIKTICKIYFLYCKGEEIKKAHSLELMKRHLMPTIILVRQLMQMLLLAKEDIVPPWNIMDSYNKIVTKFIPLLENINYFINHHIGQKGRILSLHLNKVAIFVKGQGHSIKVRYGRQFQVGRIGGNYLIVGESKEARNADQSSVKMMIEEHQTLFGEGILESFGTDRGYYSKENQIFLEKLELKEFHLPRPGTKDFNLSEQAHKLYCRRSGVEALIGHAKAGGYLGKSTAHTDRGTESQSYRAVLGLNLRQFLRDSCAMKQFTKVIEVC